MVCFCRGPHWPTVGIIPSSIDRAALPCLRDKANPLNSAIFLYFPLCAFLATGIQHQCPLFINSTKRRCLPPSRACFSKNLHGLTTATGLTTRINIHSLTIQGQTIAVAFDVFFRGQQSVYWLAGPPHANEKSSELTEDLCPLLYSFFRRFFYLWSAIDRHYSCGRCRLELSNRSACLATLLNLTVFSFAHFLPFFVNAFCYSCQTPLSICLFGFVVCF